MEITQKLMKIDELETKNAIVEEQYFIRIQIPKNEKSHLIKEIVKIFPLKYGNYEQVAFTHTEGDQQYKPLEGSMSGEIDLVHVPSEEISFVLPKDTRILKNVIETIYKNHPYEEPVIIISGVMTTKYKYNQTEDNPNKWWNKKEAKWLPKEQKVTKNQKDA
jgi:hypothetical protein